MYLPALNRVLCSNRVSQMTKTYNDIEAVTRLLEEKEKDIELTARIGKELLVHNQKLEGNVSTLETELRAANEKITQLSHELTKKTELIQILTNDVDDSGSEPTTPSGHINWDMLQHRIHRLEEENTSLRNEATQLAAATEDCEMQEKQLMSDLATQLSIVRTDLSGITHEADRYREDSRTNKALADSLQEKLSVAEQKISKLTTENEELSCMLNLAKETQSELTTELAELKERYAEVLSLLQEAQDGLKKQRKKGTPQARGGPLFPSLHSSFPTHNPDSLASELESSLFSELSLDSGIGAASGSMSNYRKVFETVRCASRASSLGSGSSIGGSPVPQSRIGGASLTHNTNVSMSTQQARISSFATSNSNIRRPRLDSVGGSDSECSDDFTYMGPSGQQGRVPGSQDLEAALRRLTPSAVMARRAALSAGMPLDNDCRTPDSIMSTGSSGGYSTMPWKMPDKLQIVKPIEGSVTLHHWSQLATPSLGGLLEENPGVRVQGGTDLETLGLTTYSLSDVEEDDEIIHPGKSFQQSGHVTTLTNSTVMHPDDNTSVTSSIRGSQMCTAMSSQISSRASSAVQTPITRSRRNSTSTFSTALGLAKMLNERGIKAATPSTLGSPNFSPTATPANSPDSSPTSSPDRSRSPSPSPSPAPYSALGLPGFLMSSGAELLRKTLTGSHQKTQHRSRQRSSRAIARQDKKAGIGLVETLERIGLETIMSTTMSTSISPSVLENVLSRRSQRSRSPTVVQSTSSITTIPNLGVPGRPGTGILESRLSQIPKAQARQPRRRTDLGTVQGPTTDNNSKQTSSLGTLSSMLFGRKGGLL
ncbi:trafficking kinesin-binding protein milt isoform X2 [Lycorma delicatula]|uniref:trafficking kinesin-binding protein milt isoform X2 n=1 Tax=Lycorma delicatula TaxID=130591 RepID=UPI003F510E9B